MCRVYTIICLPSTREKKVNMFKLNCIKLDTRTSLVAQARLLACVYICVCACKSSSKPFIQVEIR